MIGKKLKIFLINIKTLSYSGKGDNMILNEKEVLSCLTFLCERMCIGRIKIIEADVLIDDRLKITGKVIYDNQPFDISVSFLLNYRNNSICVYDIDAKVEYLFFKLNFMNLLKHVLKDYTIIYTSDSLSYSIELPIEEIKLLKQNMEIKIK